MSETNFTRKQRILVDYTTKPVEWPLSTEKQYILVDKVIPEGVNVSFTKYIYELSAPFYLSEVDMDGDPWYHDCCLFTRSEPEIMSAFKEVITNKNCETTDNTKNVSEAFNTLTGKDITPKDVDLIMQLTKAVCQWSQGSLYEDVSNA